MSYIGTDGERHRPIMIHRALFGSVERFFAVLVEHYAGAFPAWLAPVQAVVLPVSEAHADYAHEAAAELRGHGFRVEVGAADETLGNRIRRAKGEKVPYVLVVGDDDVAHRTVGSEPPGQRRRARRPARLVRRAPGRGRRGQEVARRAPGPAVGHLAFHVRHGSGREPSLAAR